MTQRPDDSLNKLIDRGRSQFIALIRDADVSDGSDYGLLARMFGYASKGLQGQVAGALRNMLPSRASGADIREWSDHYNTDAFRYSAAIGEDERSFGYAITRGTGAATVTDGDLFDHADGRQYEAVFTVALVDSSAETIYAGEWCTKRVLRCAGGPGDAGSTQYGADLRAYSYTHPVTGATKYMLALLGMGAGSSTRPVIIPADPFDFVPTVGMAFTGIYGAYAVIKATEKGKRYDLEPEETLTFNGGAPANMTDQLVVQWCDGGRDEPTESERRNGLVDSLQRRDVEQGATRAALVDRYTSQRLASPGAILTACEGRPGTQQIYRMGGLDYGEMGHDAASAVSLSQIDDSEGDVLERGRIENTGDVVDASFPELDIVMRVDPAFAPPFPAGQFTVASFTTARITLNEDPTGIIEVGDYLAITMNQAPTTSTEEDWVYLSRRVSAVAASYVDVDVALPGEPGITEMTMVPGSGVFPRVIEVIQEYLWRSVPGFESATGGLKVEAGPVPDGYHHGVSGPDLAGLLMDVDGVVEASATFDGADYVAPNGNANVAVGAPTSVTFYVEEA